MQLPVADPRVDGNLSGTVPGGRLFNEEATVSGAGCHDVIVMPLGREADWPVGIGGEASIA